MGKVLGFLEFDRAGLVYRDKKDRVKDYNQVRIFKKVEELQEQGARCMDCGTPFCHNIGCPVDNLIPEWNDAVYRGQWKEAYERLELTNNFPEFTGTICPAPCEASCTLSINDAPVTINQIELAIIDKAFEEGWVVPHPPQVETGKTVAVIGGGPAGMAAAQQLRRMGHEVTLYEKDNHVGGLMRYGIPNFKMEKHIIDRRLELMKQEGINFETGVEIGKDISISYIKNKYDAVLITVGAGAPRNLPVEGRELKGVHYAMEFLSQSAKKSFDEKVTEEAISAKGKTVLVIGGGDTGSDCVGTSIRQGAKKVYQYEIMPKPMEWDKPWNPVWPEWPRILRTSSSHKEGCEQDWLVNTNSFEGKEGKISKANLQKVEWENVDGKFNMKPVAGSEFSLDVDLVLLAMGFVHLEHGPIVKDLDLELDGRGNVKTDNYQTSCDGVFAAGDAMSGASLVVRAIAHGRNAADAVDEYLTK
ncbi:MAG: glutamate synthase subunit beta [Spirochaetales bacterium]|nr:glutamate synthase subunit beta [Spirochaetales bacterium]